MTYLHTIDGLDVLLWLLAYAAWRYLTAPRRPKPRNPQADAALAGGPTLTGGEQRTD